MVATQFFYTLCAIGVILAMVLVLLYFLCAGPDQKFFVKLIKVQKWLRLEWLLPMLIYCSTFLYLTRQSASLLWRHRSAAASGWSCSPASATRTSGCRNMRTIGSAGHSSWRASVWWRVPSHPPCSSPRHTCRHASGDSWRNHRPSSRWTVNRKHKSPYTPHTHTRKHALTACPHLAMTAAKRSTSAQHIVWRTNYAYQS